MEKKLKEIFRLHMEGGTDKNGTYTNVIPELYFEDMIEEIIKILES